MTTEQITEKPPVNLNARRNSYGVIFVLYSFAAFIAFASVGALVGASALLTIGLTVIAFWLALNAFLSFLIVCVPNLPDRMNAYSDRHKK